MAKPPVDIAAGYDQLADFWNSDGFDRSNGIDQHQRALAFCQHKGRALDIGCGSSSRIIDLLLQQGFNVEGLDVSPRMLELAMRRQPQVAFHLADIREWSPTGRYDFISAWDSIWHVPLADQKAVLTKMFGLLDRGGVCIFTMGGLDDEGEKTDSVMGPEMYYATLGIEKTLALVSEAGCVCKHLEFDQYPEPHVYLIVQRV